MHGYIGMLFEATQHFRKLVLRSPRRKRNRREPSAARTRKLVPVRAPDRGSHMPTRWLPRRRRSSTLRSGPR
jgi:hypothetical protein